MLLDELMVVVEYCEYGNLQNILRAHHRHFIDQINRTTDTIDPSITNCRAESQEVTVFMKNASQYVNGTVQADNLTISTTDLVCWSFQVASGMNYLVSRNVCFTVST